MYPEVRGLHEGSAYQHLGTTRRARHPDIDRPGSRRKELHRPTYPGHHGASTDGHLDDIIVLLDQGNPGIVNSVHYDEG